MTSRAVRISNFLEEWIKSNVSRKNKNIGSSQIECENLQRSLLDSKFRIYSELKYDNAALNRIKPDSIRFGAELFAQLLGHQTFAHSLYKTYFRDDREQSGNNFPTILHRQGRQRRAEQRRREANMKKQRLTLDFTESYKWLCSATPWKVVHKPQPDHLKK